MWGMLELVGNNLTNRWTLFFFLNNVFSYKLSFDKDFNFKIWIISWIPFFQSLLFNEVKKIVLK